MVKVNKLRSMGVEPFFNGFRVSHDIGEILRLYSGLSREALEGVNERFSVAGRIMARRDFGKAAFIDTIDRTDKIQVFISKLSLNEQEFQVYKRLDVGDFVGIEGKLFRTRTNEMTLHASRLVILGKSLRPMPEKFHKLKDVEIRYRLRYLDLIMNGRTREVFYRRSEIIRYLRQFLEERGFLEVETPMMHPIPGGADAHPFRTHHNALNMDLYLRIAPELYLKRLVVGGLERVFEINRNFRNEGLSTQHNPEFTMVEFYQAYATYVDLMEMTTQMLVGLAKRLFGNLTFKYQGHQIDLSPPWRRIHLLEAICQYGGVEASALEDLDSVRSYARKIGIDIQGKPTFGKLLIKIFDQVVEPELIQPTFIIHFPKEVSPLSRCNDQDPNLVDRFELFIGGLEVANAFSELTDPLEQRERFKEQAAMKGKEEGEVHPIDEDFIRALEYGMPPTAGEGIGIDRLVMLFTDSSSIRDVILFPQMRKESYQKG